jgi:hypothetical protein
MIYLKKITLRVYGKLLCENNFIILQFFRLEILCHFTSTNIIKF